VKYDPSLVSGLLLGVSASVLWEDLGQEGWPAAAAALIGFLVYALIDRCVHPICAFCSGQKASSKWPLVMMTLVLALHAMVDGALLKMNEGFRWAVFLHWLPESVAAYVLLRGVGSARDTAMAYGFVLLATAIGYHQAAALPFTPQATLAAIGAMAYLAIHGLHETYEHAPKRLWIAGLAAGCVFLFFS